MLVRLTKLMSTAAVATVLSVTAWGQAAQGTQQQQAQGAAESKWKDRAEYDLAESIRTETNAQKKLELLNQWKEKYPDTFYKKERATFYLLTYQQLAQVPNIVSAAKEILAIDPKDLTALYTLTAITPSMQNPQPDQLDTGEKAARGLLENMDTMFAADKKPANMGDEQWAKARRDTEAIAHKTLGWVAMVRKDNPTAEKHFVESLQRNNAAGEISYWTGQVIVSQLAGGGVTDEIREQRMPQALWHFSRAVAYDGPGALAPAGRQQIDAYLVKQYNRFTGGSEGLDKLKADAKASALPPSGFTVKSALAKHREELENQKKLESENPLLARWLAMKEGLTGAGSQQYWEAMKGAKLPELKGKIVGGNAKEIQVALSDATTPEVTLRSETPLGKVEPGTTIQFEGVAQSFTQNPLMLILDVEKADVKGLSAAAAPKPGRSGGAAKKGAAKKKK